MPIDLDLQNFKRLGRSGQLLIQWAAPSKALDPQTIRDLALDQVIVRLTSGREGVRPRCDYSRLLGSKKKPRSGRTCSETSLALLSGGCCLRSVIGWFMYGGRCAARAPCWPEPWPGTSPAASPSKRVLSDNGSAYKSRLWHTVWDQLENT